MPLAKLSFDQPTGWTVRHYRVFRLVFGSYLFFHFSALVPWGKEIFSAEGVLPAKASPLVKIFPNVLGVFDSPTFVTALLVAATILSVLFAIGLYDRLAALILWYIWACLFGRNPLISNPGLPYVGWLLVAHATLPGHWLRPRSSANAAHWQNRHARLFTASWILLALGYSYSGYTKLVSPSWLEGTALTYVLEGPLARPGGLRNTILALPTGVLACLTWGTLGLELLFAPLALVRRLRPWLWLLLGTLHIGLILVVDFADLSLGMLMFHLFTFDPAWLARTEHNERPPTLRERPNVRCEGDVRE